MRTIRMMLALVMFLPAFACSAQTEKKDIKAGSADKVEVYYFHYNARCYTCRNVEAKAKENIDTLYPELVKQGKISFQSVNLDEESGKEIAGKLKVYSQTLLIVKGDQKINITNEGFMYAAGQPDKFKSVIKEKIDGLLKI